MNEKEAREQESKRCTGFNPCCASTYLEAIEKAKGLEEALKQINDEAYAKTLDTVQLENWLIVMTEKALAKWEKTK